jgi:hypothetical protein
LKKWSGTHQFALTIAVNKSIWTKICVLSGTKIKIYQNALRLKLLCSFLTSEGFIETLNDCSFSAKNLIFTKS